MKTMLLLVDDEYAAALRDQLSADRAWILDARYDAFRCQLHCALDAYRDNPDGCEAYHDTISLTDSWLTERQV